MSCPKSELGEKVKNVRQKAEEILNKGVIGKEPLRIRRTLEFHERIKILLEEMDYILENDVSDEELVSKVSDIEREFDVIKKESERWRMVTSGVM